jgi:hypothetical protein
VTRWILLASDSRPPSSSHISACLRGHQPGHLWHTHFRMICTVACWKMHRNSFAADCRLWSRPRHGCTFNDMAVSQRRTQTPQKRNKRTQILYILRYQKFYVISPSAKISHWNRPVTSTLEFWKIN